MTAFPTKWSIEFTEKASKEFNKLDLEVYRKITNFIDNRLLQVSSPRLLGKPLSGNLREFWSYRVGDYRLICEIVDHKLTIIAVKIAHRREVYKHLQLPSVSS